MDKLHGKSDVTVSENTLSHPSLTLLQHAPSRKKEASHYELLLWE
jgi:hypothetical protein